MGDQIKALFKFTNSILNDEPIFIYNHGNMEKIYLYRRSIFSISKLTFKIPELNSKGSTTIENDIYLQMRLGDCKYRNSSPVNLMDFIKTLEEALNKKAKKNCRHPSYY